LHTLQAVSTINLLPFTVALVLGWVFASLAVYFAGRVVAGQKATLAASFVITLVGPILVALVGFTTVFIFGSISPLIGLLLALLAWLWLVKSMFNVGWLAAFGVSILAVFMFIVVVLLVSLVLGVTSFLVGFF